MPDSILCHATEAPVPWTVSLSRQPGRATLICVAREFRRGSEVVGRALHHLLLDEARGLADRLRIAVAAGSASQTREAALEHRFAWGAPWSVFAHWRGNQQARIKFTGAIGEFPGNRVTCEHSLLLSEAKSLIAAFDELLAKVAAFEQLPASELPADADPNPERHLPGYQAIPEFLRPGRDYERGLPRFEESGS